jgi:TIR domain
MAKSRRRVFISAAASDAPRVQELTARLNAVGIDARDSATQALPGTNVLADLGRALDKAEALVVLISPAAMKSSMVRHDIQFALGQERFQNRLIPVLVKPTPAEDIPWILRTLQWAKGNADQVAGQVLKALDAPKGRESRAEAR